MSDISDYNEALIAAKLTALKTLRELLRTCENPTERLRIIQAILRVKPSDLEMPATKPQSRKVQQAPAPAPPPAAVPAPAPEKAKDRPRISRHALGTLNLDCRSLPILSGLDGPAPLLLEDAPLPIALTPSNEPTQFGGPVTARPLPLPLGPPRA